MRLFPPIPDDHLTENSHMIAWDNAKKAFYAEIQLERITAKKHCVYGITAGLILLTVLYHYNFPELEGTIHGALGLGILGCLLFRSESNKACSKVFEIEQKLREKEYDLSINTDARSNTKEPLILELSNNKSKV